jgi:hypothetical protein
VHSTAVFSHPHLAGNTCEGGPRATSSVYTFIEGLVTCIIVTLHCYVHKGSSNWRRGPGQKYLPPKAGSRESEEESSLTGSSLQGALGSTVRLPVGEKAFGSGHLTCSERPELEAGRYRRSRTTEEGRPPEWQGEAHRNGPWMMRYAS